jgi:primosomal protein N' (replication factor Y)
MVEQKVNSGATREDLYAYVAVDEPLDQAYLYRVPDDMRPEVAVGKLVQVPLGPQRTAGCIVDLSNSCGNLAPARIKNITRILTPSFALEGELIAIAQWMSEYYLAPLGQTLCCVSFIGFNDVTSLTQRAVRLAAGVPVTGRLTAGQQRAIEFLEHAAAPVPIKELIEKAGVSAAVIDNLVRKGVLERSDLPLERQDDYEFPAPAEFDSPLPLTPHQAVCLEPIIEALSHNQPQTFLLHGVTGSGKTEIYLQAIAKAIGAGGSAIVLVPEIALTPQTVDRFRRRFGESAGVYHSRLTVGQKFDLWQRIRRGDCRILIGARSAVFAPLPNLKIIIVDEEHEPTYKQETTPRYHARDVAIMRAHRSGAVVVLGSATPNVETYHKAVSGKFQLLQLPERIDGRPLPPISVIDLTQKVRENLDVSIFSPEAVQSMRTTVEAGHQVLVFLNRRGFFNFTICMDCKRTLTCEQCDIALTYHKVGDRLICHYCGYSMRRPTACPYCDSTELTMVGLGTQRVEDEVARLFPDKRILRIDLDTMRHRTAYIDMWRMISQREVDIIVGTQMIARGIHLEGIALVVVPLADVSLFQPDFRSAERAFALLTQVAGRAGRGDAPGQVLIQTYVPYHYAVHYARSHDYVGFYEKEIHIRKVLRFPPFSRLIAFLGICDDFDTGQQLFAEFVRELQNQAYPWRDRVTVLGPTPAPILKLEGMYRWRALMRSTDAKKMRDITRAAFERFRKVKRHSRLQVVTDVDPYDLL